MRFRRAEPSLATLPSPMTTPARAATSALVTVAALAAAACQKGPAYGSDNAVIAVVDPALRAEVEPILRRGLEREVLTTRPEKEFQVTFTTPERLGEFRRWRRLVVVEPLGQATLVPELVDPPEGGGPVFARTEDEWALDQSVWVLAADTPAATVELVRQRVDSLYRAFHAGYVDHQVDRMWASGRDSTLLRRLLETRGFGIVLPRVYDSAPGSAPDSSLVWYNGNPRRIVSLHWLPRPAALTADTVLAIRAAWGREIFPGEEIPTTIPPDTAPAPGGDDDARGGAATPDTAGAALDVAVPLQVERVELGGRDAVRLQGVWTSAEDPLAGLFLTYGVACGDRLVLLDGNLYAPDRDKAPYLLQLERIFDTFTCAADA